MENTIRTSKCGHCGKGLPRYRKFFMDPFCSGAHKKAYTEELNLLAIERLRTLDEILKSSPEYSPTLSREELIEV